MRPFSILMIRAVSVVEKTFNGLRQQISINISGGGEPLVKSWNLGAAVIIFTIACIVIPVAASVNFSTSVPQVITKGDTFFITGTDAKNGPVAVWIFGGNYFAVRTVIPERSGDFSLAIKPDETRKFSSGKYAVVLQDPGPDGKMQIEPGKSATGNITILNRGKKIADIGPQEDLHANVEPVVEILEHGATLQGVDDTFVSDYLFVEEPVISFDKIARDGMLPVQITGEPISFSGTTNVGTENSLHADIRDEATNTLITTKMILVVPGGAMNHWSYELLSPGLPEGHYFLTVGWTKSNITGTGSAGFSVENPSPQTQQPGPVGTPNTKPGDELPIPLIIISAMMIVVIIIIYSTLRK